MQMPRHQADALHADAVHAIRRRDRERVGADDRLVGTGQCDADRQMLSRPVRKPSCPVVRLQMKRADRAAFVDDPSDPERAPLRRKLGRAHPVGGLRPVAGHQRVRRPAIGPERPAQRQRAAPAHHAAGTKAPQPLGALECRDLRRVQDHLGIAGQLQHVAGFEIDECQPGLAVDEDVAERVEEQIAGEIGDRQRAVGGDADEARSAAAMRDVDLATVLTLGIGRHEERVRRRDRVARSLIERRALLDRSGERFVRLAHEGEVAQLDILRTIAKALIELEAERLA
ncbi:hypothetical protein ACVW1C_005293 [Bradyrhizobium sp. USDA 4011]